MQANPAARFNQFLAARPERSHLALPQAWGNPVLSRGRQVLQPEADRRQLHPPQVQHNPVAWANQFLPGVFLQRNRPLSRQARDNRRLSQFRGRSRLVLPAVPRRRYLGVSLRVQTLCHLQRQHQDRFPRPPQVKPRPLVLALESPQYQHRSLAGELRPHRLQAVQP